MPVRNIINAKVLAHQSQNLFAIRTADLFGNMVAHFENYEHCGVTCNIVKPVLSGHSKEDQKLVFKTDYR